MAKIIEKGSIPELSGKLRCPKCKTLAEYAKEDVHTDRDGSYVKCPLCGSFLDAVLLAFNVVSSERI